MPAAPQPGADGDKPHTQRFRRPAKAALLDRDQARRQGRIAHLAWEMLDGRDDVIAFLNTHDSELGGRPLDMAVDSDAGLLRIETAMRARAAARGRRMLEEANVA